MAKLTTALKKAQELTANNEIEERGGIILHHSDTDDYQFYELRNVNAGNELAQVLWTVDRYDYAKQIIPLLSKGWKHYASFHTHPRFQPYPSSIDVSELFTGFKINYICSGLDQRIIRYEWKNNQQTLEGTEIKL